MKPVYVAKSYTVVLSTKCTVQSFRLETVFLLSAALPALYAKKKKKINFEGTWKIFHSLWLKKNNF